LVPAFTPFTFHWYIGKAPSLTGVAVKVTELPAQTGFCEAATEMLTGSKGFTVMVIAFDVAGLFEIQTSIDDVNTQVTISLFAGA
jgi:hypothetical protein